MADTYRTISAPSEGLYKEKMSKFISLAAPCATVEEATAHVTQVRNRYHDARHVCWAYMIGAERDLYRSNDDGEPSGTAGKPILGQINSFELTNVCVAVVRYFGGIKLGTSGLIEAYRTAAADALSAAEIVERVVEEQLTVAFDYALMGEVMRIAKDGGATVVAQDFQMDCRLTLSVRRDDAPRLRLRYEQTFGVRLVDAVGEA